MLPYSHGLEWHVVFADPFIVPSMVTLQNHAECLVGLSIHCKHTSGLQELLTL